jgi:hypothetical protein
MAALWIPDERADRTRNAGYTVVDGLQRSGHAYIGADSPLRV